MLAGLVAGHKSRMLISSLFMLQLFGMVASGFMRWAHHKSLRKARSRDLGTYTCDSGRVSAKRVCSPLISKLLPARVRVQPHPARCHGPLFCVLLEQFSSYFFWVFRKKLVTSLVTETGPQKQVGPVSLAGGDPPYDI